MSSKLLALVLSGISVGCGSRFQPNYNSAWDCFDHLQSVPAILVAKIGPDAISDVGKPFTDNSIFNAPIVLLRVKITIENVLKGTVTRGNTDFFYFAQEIPTGPPSDGFFSPGTFRDILLLRQEKGKLRLIRDIRSHCAATVYSGAHPNFNLRPGEPLSEQLIDLLLTPGSDATDIGMLWAIFERTPFDISPDYTAQTLLKLATFQPPVVRTAACLEFRDDVADLATADTKEELALSKRFGLSPAIVERWQKLQTQNGWAKDWWANGLVHGRLPSTLLPDDGPSGLSLCTNDKALGVPPLRKP